MNKLNFGCGSIQPEGWVNVDKVDFGQQYIGSTDLFGSNTFDYIVAHCTLQINEFHDIPQLLNELYRILKPGGVLRISLPDISRGFGEYLRENKSFFPNGEENLHLRFCAWLTWYSTTRTLLTQPALAQLLFNAGFKNYDVAVCSFKNSTYLPNLAITELDTRENECYFMEARK